MPWEDDYDFGFPEIEEPIYIDEYESGYQGGDSDGSIGAPDPGPDGYGGGGFDWSQLGGAGGSASSMLSALFKGLGIGGDKAGSLLPLLSALMGGAGLINQNSATGKASQQLQDAANKSNEQATALVGGAREAFQPYMTAGTDALGKMQGIPASALGAQFMQASAPSNLASKHQGKITLGQLARR